MPYSYSYIYIYILEHYIDRSNRDKRAAQLRAQGYTVTKRTSRNQCISPDYIEDYPTTYHRLPDGFGGSADTFIPRLYTIEAEAR